MTELLSNPHALLNIVQFTANVALATAIVVWVPTIWRAVRGEAKQDKTIKSYIDEIGYLQERLVNETTTVYLDNPDGTTYVGPLNAKLALEALQSAREAELDLKIRFADDFPTLEQYITDHQED